MREIKILGETVMIPDVIDKTWRYYLEAKLYDQEGNVITNATSINLRTRKFTTIDGPRTTTHDFTTHYIKIERLNLKLEFYR